MNQNSERAPRIAVIGTGRLAHALVRMLPQRVRLVVGRDPAAAADLAGLARRAVSNAAVAGAEIDVLWIATSDHAIADVAAEVASSRESWAGVLAIHSSGSLPVAALEPFERRGARILALHPNAAVSAEAAIPPGVIWGVTASFDDPENVVRWLLGESAAPTLLRIEDRHRPFYHAAASAAANYTITLYRIAQLLYSRCGIDDETSRRLVRSFQQDAIDRASAVGAEAAITGPVVRGDIEVVAAQLDAVAVALPSALAAYAELARATVALFAPGMEQAVARLIDRDV